MILKTSQNNNIISILQLIFSIILLLTLSSCIGQDPYLYDRSGFDNGVRPVVRPNPNANRIPPDSWAQEQQVPQRRQDNYQQPNYYPQQQYAPQPYYQNGGYPPAQGYAPQPQNGSRYYNNPYIDVPQQNYNPYRDSEQYYTPPNYYYNNEDPRNVSY